MMTRYDFPNPAGLLLIQTVCTRPCTFVYVFQSIRGILLYPPWLCAYTIRTLPNLSKLTVTRCQQHLDKLGTLSKLVCTDLAYASHLKFVLGLLHPAGVSRGYGIGQSLAAIDRNASDRTATKHKWWNRVTCRPSPPIRDMSSEGGLVQVVRRSGEIWG
jgi:hypothetical protein